MTPNQQSVLALFASEGVRYVAIGGYAMRCHGFERATSDLDLWIERSPDNAAKVARVIELLSPGSAPAGYQWHEVFEMEACLVEYPSLHKEVDILTGLGRMNFVECYARSDLSSVDGVSLRVLCIQDLFDSKQQALEIGTNIPGRIRDQADYDQLSARLSLARGTDESPAIVQDPKSWELGYKAGHAGDAALTQPSGVDGLAWSSGFIEGRADREAGRVRPMTRKLTQQP